MRLQTKLVGGFFVLALFTLMVATVGYWQARNLATALYEIGTVRLPSLRGLEAMNEALTALRGAERLLLAHELDPDEFKRAQADMERAWERAERGRELYEPLPQTEGEAITWRAFVPAWERWRADHDALVALARAGRLQDDPRLQAEARLRFDSSTEPRADEANRLLAELIAINHAIVVEAQLRSIASQGDLMRVRGIMLGAAVAGVVGAILAGLILGRRLTRPIVQISRALDDVARGDLPARVTVSSSDEVGRMGEALNEMIEALRTSKARLQVVTDNLPDTMLYQVVREADGRMRFLYVSAGVAQLHGVLAGTVLKDPRTLYDQIDPEDRKRMAEAEQASLRDMRRFSVVVRTLRTANNEVRWRHICSAPRRLPDGRVVWDGFETDITEHRRALNALQAGEDLLRQFVKYTPAAVAMFDRQMCYIQASDRWLADYHLTGQEMVGRSHYDVFPDIPERWKAVHQRVLGGAVERCNEDPFPRADGSMEWLQWEVRPWRNGTGAIGGLTMFTQVITERKRTEQKLAEQLAELRRWHTITLGREERILQLKREVNDFAARLHEPPPYPAAAAVTTTASPHG